MILTNTFDLNTFTHSDTADKLKIDNTELTDDQSQNLQRLHELLTHIQNRLSIKYARPIQIKINSGYRCAELNKAIGGVATSEHCLGSASDTVAIGIPIKDYYQHLRQLAKDKVIVFGQVIVEFGKHPDKESDDWIHIALPRKNHINDFIYSVLNISKRSYVKEPIGE